MVISVTMAPVTVMTPTLVGVLAELCSVNHRLPSGAEVRPKGVLAGVLTGNSVTTPAVVMRPILPPGTFSVNQRFLSEPIVSPQGSLAGVIPTSKVVTAPVVGLSRATALAAEVSSVNQRLPSGPCTMLAGSTQPCGQLGLWPPGTLYPVTAPVVVIFSTFCPSKSFESATQRALPGPEVTPRGSLPLMGTWNSVIAGEGARARLGCGKMPRTTSDVHTRASSTKARVYHPRPPPRSAARRSPAPPICCIV